MINSASNFDTKNWENWDANQVCKYIEYVLIENNYNKNDIE